MPLVVQNLHPQVIKNARFNVLLLNDNLINTVKIYTAIHLGLNKMDVLEAVILLMTYLIRYVFEIKHKF